MIAGHLTIADGCAIGSRHELNRIRGQAGCFEARDEAGMDGARGLGRSIVNALHREGARVAINYLTSQRQAEASIQDDPLVRQMIQQFAAVIRADSIEPLDTPVKPLTA